MKSPFDYAIKTSSEFAHQTALFMWASMAAQCGVELANDPNSYIMRGYGNTPSKRGKPILELKFLFAIKNAGHGDPIRGSRSRMEGVKAGVPDICLPVENVNYGGLYIEMKKVNKGIVSDKQSEWHDFLRSHGYCVEVCHGWLAARDIILKYLER